MGKIIVAALLLTLGYFPFPISLVLCSAVILLLLNYLKRQPVLFGFSLVLFIYSSLFAPTFGSFEPSSFTKSYADTLKITTQPIVNENYIEVEGKLSNSKRVIIRHEALGDEVVYGAICQANLILESPNRATNPGQFDYQQFLLKKGISAVSYEGEITSCEGKSVLTGLFSLRGKILTHVTDSLSLEMSAWINALLFGDRSALEDSVEKSFQFWNISHLLAISGLHVGLILSFCYGFLYYICRFTKESAMNVMIFFIPIYILLAGSQPSVLRAGLMAVCIILLVKLKVKLHVFDILALTYIVSLIFDPYLIFQVAFQLSFAVTASLVLSKNILFKDGWVWMSLKISLISQIAILPIQFYYFYFTNVFSFLMNLLFVPYFTLFLIPFSSILFLMSFLSLPLANILDSLMQKINSPIIEALVHFEQFPISQWVVGRPHWLAMLVYYMLFFWFMYTWSQDKLKKATLISLSMIAVFWVQQLTPYLDSSYKITMLDIGQGDTFIVELPYRKGVFVIDAGEEVKYVYTDRPDRNISSIVQPYLWSKGIRTIDGLLISHYDYDHAKGAESVIEQFEPDFIVIPPRKDQAERLKYIGFKDAIEMSRGERLKYKDAEFVILAPHIDHLLEDENADSLVFILNVSGHRTLFAGDIEEAREKLMIQTMHIGSIHALKVAHHGSDTSSSEAFLDWLNVNGIDAFISVGRDNRYGHPSMDVIERLCTRDYNIWRTDEHGAVELKYLNGQRTIKTFLP